jgi:tetratricopeptide (TPR) repeat protein
MIVLGLWHRFQMYRHGQAELRQAEQAEQEKDVAEQLASLGRYLQFAPSDSAIRARYGLLLATHATSRREKWRALQVLVSTLLKDPGHAELRIKAAELALELGDAEDALRYLAPEVSRQAEDPAWHELHARILQALGYEVEAAAALEVALSLDPGRVGAATRLASLYHDRLRRPQRAEEALNRLVLESPDRAGALVARARFRAARGQYDDALADLQHAVQIDPQHLLARVSWAELADRSGDPSALDQWQKAWEIAPDRPELSLALARCLREHGNDNQAQEVLHLARERLGNQPAIILALAEIYLDKGEWDEGQHLRELLPPDAQAARLYLRGMSERRQGDLQAAMASLDEALKKRTLPRDLASRAALELSRVYQALELREERLSAARQAIASADTLASRLEHGEAALEIGLVDEALTSLRSAVSARETNGQIPPALSLLLARALTEANARLPLWRRSWAEWEPALRAARQHPSTQADAGLVEARGLELRGQPKQALALLEQLAKDQPRYAPVWIALADYQARYRLVDGLRATLQQGDEALRNDPLWLESRLRTVRDAPERDRLFAQIKRLPHPERDRLERRLVDLYLRQRHYALATPLLRDLIARHPEDVRYRLWQIELLLAQGDEAQARTRIDALRRREGEEGIAWRCAEAERLINTDPAAAQELAEVAHELQPTYSRPLWLLARLAEKREEYDKALSYLAATLERGDWSPEPVQRSLQLLLAAGRYTEADALLERAQYRGVFDPAWKQSAAWIALQAGRPARARELALAALPPGKRTYRDLLWLAGVLEGSNHPTEAEARLIDAIALVPDALEPRLRLVRLLRSTRRLDRAERAFREMIDAMPPHRARLAEALGHEALGQLTQAVDALQKRLSERPRDPESLYRLVDLQLRLGWWDEARQSLDTLLAPDGPAQPEDLPRLRRQRALLECSPEALPAQRQKALELLEQTRLEGRFGTEDQTAQALVKGWQTDEREAALEWVLSQPPRDPLLRIRWAQLLDAADQWDRARAIYIGLANEDSDTPLYPALLVEGLLRHKGGPETILWYDRLRRLDPDSERTRHLGELIKK